MKKEERQKGFGKATEEGGGGGSRRIWWSAITCKGVTHTGRRKDKEVRRKEPGSKGEVCSYMCTVLREPVYVVS